MAVPGWAPEARGIYSSEKPPAFKKKIRAPDSHFPSRAYLLGYGHVHSSSTLPRIRVMKNSLSAAIIGAGFIGPVHLEALRRLGIPVAGILGVDEAESRRAAARWGLPRAYRRRRSGLRTVPVSRERTRTMTALAPLSRAEISTAMVMMIWPSAARLKMSAATKTRVSSISSLARKTA